MYENDPVWWDTFTQNALSNCKIWHVLKYKLGWIRKLEICQLSCLPCLFGNFCKGMIKSIYRLKGWIVFAQSNAGGGGTQIIFFDGVPVWNPYPYLWIFLPLMADFTFPPPPKKKNHKSGPISKGFSTSRMADFIIFFTFFVKWDPLLRIFLTKIGPMSKDFFDKTVTHLGTHPRMP